MGTSACDLDLRLGFGDDGSRPINSGGMLRSGAAEEEQQQMTIFYQGKICVCDATEIKARAIISMARRETDEQITKEKKKTEEEEENEANGSPPSLIFQAPPSPEKVLMNPELPMKRSLQRFLQKRKSRLTTNAASHPYAADAARQFPVLKLVL